MTENMPEWEREQLRSQPIHLDTESAELETEPARNKAVSLARTLVPIIWGAILTFLATRIPSVHGFVQAQEVILLPALEAALTFAWYALFRWVEDHLPAWLTRFVLGANAQPIYVAPSVVSTRR